MDNSEELDNEANDTLYQKANSKNIEKEQIENRNMLNSSKKIWESKMDLVVEVNNELQEKINGFEEEKKKIVDQKNLENQQNLDQLKQKVLDFIKNSNKNNGNQFKANDLTSRLNILHNNQLLCELEFQSLQIEDLLKQREQLDKIILELKHDLKIHKEVERVLSEKNKKYTDMIKVLSNKIDEMNSGNIQTNQPNSAPKEILSSKGNYVCPCCGANSKQGEKVIVLQKELTQKQREIESLKANYDTAKSKLNYIEKKYSNIFSLFETVLEQSYQDPKFQKNKEIFINLDDYKKCNFEELKSEEKYSLALMLMKYIVPLVNSEMSHSESYNNSVNNVRTKYFFNKEDSTLTFSSINDTSSFRSTKGHLRKISDLRKKAKDLSRNFQSSSNSLGGYSNHHGLPSLRGSSGFQKTNSKKMYSVLKA